MKYRNSEIVSAQKNIFKLIDSMNWKKVMYLKSFLLIFVANQKVQPIGQTNNMIQLRLNIILKIGSASNQPTCAMWKFSQVSTKKLKLLKSLQIKLS